MVLLGRTQQGQEQYTLFFTFQVLKTNLQISKILGHAKVGVTVTADGAVGFPRLFQA